MNFEYCSACGSKIEYLLKKPNFCPSCGTQIGKEGVSPHVPKHSLAAAQNHEEDAEGTDVSRVPDIHGLQYELDGDYGGIGRSYGSLGDLLGAAPNESKQPASPKKKKKASTKLKPPNASAKFEAVKKTMEECKSSADQIVDVGEG